MLLMTETRFDNVKYAEQVDEATGKKNLFIEGIYLEGENKNRNGRIYPDAILSREANRYIEEVISQNRALGELNHPPHPQVNPERASHRIISLEKVGTNWKGKALVLDTPMGNIVRGIIEGGTQIGVSSRGLGSLKEDRGRNAKIIQDDYYLSTVDVVSDPSAPAAWVNGIYESAQWCVGGMCEMNPDPIFTEIKDDIEKIVKNTMSMSERNVQFSKLFENFCMSLIEKGNKWTLEELNDVFIKMSMNPRKILDVLSNIDTKKSTFTWDEISKALLAAGMSKQSIAATLKALG